MCSVLRTYDPTVGLVNVETRKRQFFTWDYLLCTCTRKKIGNVVMVKA
jgi:hypothetical protein